MLNELQRAAMYQEMVIGCDRMIAVLQVDLNLYHNPLPYCDKYRLMFSYSWVTKKLAKYTAIKERLNKSLTNIIASLQVQQAA